MSKPSLRPQVPVAPFSALIVLAAAATQLSGCVTRVVATSPLPAAQADVQVYEAPPPLPVYEQPPCPEEGYIWTPGYWAWAPGGYYWVPGTWVAPPRVGLLWTPGYWGFVGGVYVFHAGYWGPHVGFYGGVNYGFGYGGVGYLGGRWVGTSFAYNQSVTNVNVTVVHNTYNETVVNHTTVNRVSYNGGSGGITTVPSAQERRAAEEAHVPPTQAQRQHVQQAAANPALMAKNNGGRPSIAATAHAAAFNAPGVVGGHGAVVSAPSHAQPASSADRPHGAAPAANARPQTARPKPHPKSPEAGKHEEKTAQR